MQPPKVIAKLAAPIALLGLGVLLAAPPPARAQSCDPRLYSRRSPQKEVYRLGTAINFTVFIDRNGSGCGRRIHPKQVDWTVRHGKGVEGPLTLRSRKHGRALKWRFKPRRAGVYVIKAEPQILLSRLKASVARHVFLVIDPTKRSRVRHGVRFRITTGPGLRVRRWNTLRLLRVHRRLGGKRTFTESWSTVRWRAGRTTGAAKLPPGEYVAVAPIRPRHGDLRRRFKVQRATTISLDFTAVQLSLRLGWTPFSKRLTATLWDAAGVRRKSHVTPGGVATFDHVAAGQAKLIIHERPRKVSKHTPSLPPAGRRLRTQTLVIPRATAHTVALPAVYLYTQQRTSSVTTDWTKWPGLASSQPTRWSPNSGPPADIVTSPLSAVSALASKGKWLVALHRSLRRTDGKRWWHRTKPKSLQAARPLSIAMIDAETFAWVDAGHRFYNYVTYNTRLGLSQEIFTIGRFCETTSIAATSDKHLVVAGRCRALSPKRGSLGFLAVRDKSGWKTVKLKVGPLSAVAAHGKRVVAVGKLGTVVVGSPGGPWHKRRLGRQDWYAVSATAKAIWLGNKQGLWKTSWQRRSRARRIKLPWTTQQSPHAVQSLTPIPGGGLLALFGPHTTGYCPRHHRSRLAQYRHGRWKTLHKAYAQACTRCHIAGGRCTPHPGSVVQSIALLGKSIWSILKTPLVRPHPRGHTKVHVKHTATLR